MNWLMNQLILRSSGRLSPFIPLADDDGIDLLIFDKVTGKSIAFQIKSRTVTLYKKNKKKPEEKTRGNIVHFEVRQATFNVTRNLYILCVLMTENKYDYRFVWLLSIKDFLSSARKSKGKYSINANISTKSQDKFVKFRYDKIEMVVEKIISLFDDKILNKPE